MEEKKGFFGRAFEDMAESARQQHEADKLNLQATHLETLARHEEAKSRPKREALEAQARKDAAQARLDQLKGL